MTAYPGSERERRIDSAALGATTAGIFEACGMGAGDARILAESLVDADLRGVHSHGVMRIPNYCGRLLEGGVDPQGRPSVGTDAGAALIVDGGNAMGQIACRFALEHTIARAKETGVAFAAVGNSNHCGALAWYVSRAIEQDLIAIMGTNALPTMAPWGGSERILGMNPIGVGIPTGDAPPFVHDAAFAGSALGKIVVYGQKGFAIPEGWAFDASGRPTTDPAAAIAGLLRPIGDHKGANLAMVSGILSTLLSGAGYGTELGSLEAGATAGRDGQFIIALDVARFVDVATFRVRMDGIVAQIHACRPAPGVERLFSPGEIEHETAQRYRAEGIPLNEETLADIAATARRLHVDATAIAPA